MKARMQVSQYIRFLLHSTSRFGIHSPFMYELVTRVINDRQGPEDLQEVEKIRKVLCRSDEIIRHTDFGAGHNGNIPVTGMTPLRRIARWSSVPPRYGRLLYRLVKHFQPENILEIGTSLGISTMYMSRAAGGSRIFTLEGCRNIAARAEEHFHALKMDNIQVHIGSFDHLLPVVLDEMQRVDLVFIDGNHRYSPTMRYFEMILPFTHNDSIFVFDDIYWSGGMQQAWKDITKRATASVNLCKMGIVFMKKELSRQEFCIRY